MKIHGQSAAQTKKWAAAHLIFLTRSMITNCHDKGNWSRRFPCSPAGRIVRDRRQEHRPSSGRAPETPTAPTDSIGAVVYRWEPCGDLLSHGLPHYHRRGLVSRSCSGWEGVVPRRYGRKAKRFGTEAVVGVSAPDSEEVSLGVSIAWPGGQTRFWVALGVARLSRALKAIGSSRTGN